MKTKSQPRLEEEYFLEKEKNTLEICKLDNISEQ